MGRQSQEGWGIPKLTIRASHTEGRAKLKQQIEQTLAECFSLISFERSSNGVTGIWQSTFA